MARGAPLGARHKELFRRAEKLLASEGKNIEEIFLGYPPAMFTRLLRPTSLLKKSVWNFQMPKTFVKSGGLRVPDTFFHRLVGPAARPDEDFPLAGDAPPATGNEWGAIVGESSQKVDLSLCERNFVSGSETPTEIYDQSLPA